MRSPSLRSHRIASLMVAPLAVMAAAGVVWKASYSAFSAETRNSGNSWSTGVVALTDDDSGSARFNVTNLVPAQTETKCIKVTSSASVPGTVKLYILNPVTSVVGLETHIKLTVTNGNGGDFASCTGYTSTGTVIATQTLGTAETTYTSYATGAGVTDVAHGLWVTTGVVAGESKTYQLTWLFDSSGLTQDQLDALQGAHVGLDFEWEVQNN
jgi:hypothetical protein